MLYIILFWYNIPGGLWADTKSLWKSLLIHRLHFNHLKQSGKSHYPTTKLILETDSTSCRRSSSWCRSSSLCRRSSFVRAILIILHKFLIKNFSLAFCFSRNNKTGCFRRTAQRSQIGLIKTLIKSYQYKIQIIIVSFWHLSWNKERIYGHSLWHLRTSCKSMILSPDFATVLYCISGS